MNQPTPTEIRWWPRLDDLPKAIFPPGWLAFGLRTWIAVCLALSVAFWSQIDAPAGAAVTVMILAQPLRGQALSKAFYRLVGTAFGVAVSILLISLFSQNRALLLGATALWLAACAFVGSLERDFRSYAALLAGYTVTLVAINTIDAPQNVFHIALSRASCIAIGVASVAIVNMFFGSPAAGHKLANALEELAIRIRLSGRDALMGDPIPSPMRTTALAAEILSLSTQISYARTELDRGKLRVAGARLAIIGMLTVLTCSRVIATILHRKSVSEIAIKHARLWHERQEDNTDREQTLVAILAAIHAEQPDYVPDRDDAYFLERSATLLSNRLHIRTGIDTLQNATPAGDAIKLAQLHRHPDYVTAFVNGVRVLLGFSVTAGLCIASDLPASSLALSQTALTLTLASTALDTAQFGIGAMIGLPLAVAVAAWMNFWILPHIADMGALSLVFLPQTLFACILLANPKVNAIGFNYGAFFPVILGLGNHHSFDPTTFIARNIFYLLAAVVSFIMLVLILPPSPKRQRFRVAVTIGRDIEKLLANKGEPLGPALLSRKYDRLAQALVWTKRIRPQNAKNAPPAKAPERVFNRLVAFEDFATTLARARAYLEEAQAIPALKRTAAHARAALEKDRLNMLHDEIPDLSRAFLKNFPHQSGMEQAVIVICVGALQAVYSTLEQSGSALRHYGIGQTRW